MTGENVEETRATVETPPEDELLCTMCGLTACWTTPGKAPGQGSAEKDGTEASRTP